MRSISTLAVEANSRGLPLSITLPRVRVPAAVAELRRTVGDQMIINTEARENVLAVAGVAQDRQSVQLLVDIVIVDAVRRE